MNKKKIILDPIIYSESSYKFISNITRKYIINKILPLCFIVTPNEFEDKMISNEINTFSGYYLITGIKTKDKVKCYLYKNKRLKKIFEPYLLEEIRKFFGDPISKKKLSKIFLRLLF